MKKSMYLVIYKGVSNRGLRNAKTVNAWNKAGAIGKVCKALLFPASMITSVIAEDEEVFNTMNSLLKEDENVLIAN